MTLVTDKMDGHDDFNIARHECLPKKTKMTRYYVATKGLLERQSVSFIKVSGQMHSDKFKRKPAFSFTVIISAYNSFL